MVAEPYTTIWDLALRRYIHNNKFSHTEELVVGELGQQGGQEGVLVVEQQHGRLTQALQVADEAQQAGLLSHRLQTTTNQSMKDLFKAQPTGLLRHRL